MASVLTVVLTAGMLVTGAGALQRPTDVVDGEPGVSRVIVWDGVTPSFLRALEQVAPYDHVYDYGLIRGVAVAVAEADVQDVIDFAEARGLDARPDEVVQADLTTSTNVIQVKPDAWDAGYTGEGTTIAIIDSGIDDAHVSLDDQDDSATTTDDPKVLAFRDYVNGGGNAAEPYDDNGHGTHVAGIAAGTGGGTPRIGVAHEANLVGLKVLNSAGSGSSTNIIAAIQWIADNINTVDPPIRAANISIGAIVGGSPDGSSPQSQAVDAATRAGVAFALSAGNGDTDGATPNLTSGNISAPGDARLGIAVCSTDKQGNNSTWDSEGPSAHEVPKPDVCAPGESISSADTNTGDGWVSHSGTSMAAPHVAGVAALVAQAVPHITAEDIRQAIIDTASRKAAGQAHSNQEGWGIARAKDAIDLAVSRFGGVGVLDARSGGPYRAIENRTMTLRASVAGGDGTYTYAWDLDADGTFETTGRTASFPARPLGTYGVSVRVTDGSGATDVEATTVTVTSPVSLYGTDVETGEDGWVPAVAAGNATTPGWHIQDHHAQSPTQAWYVGDDATRLHGHQETVTLTRDVDFTGQNGRQLLMSFGMSGSIENGWDFLRVQIRETDGVFEQVGAFDDTDESTWQTKTVDISGLAGKQGQIQFHWRADDVNDPFLEPAATGPYVDDIEILGAEIPAPDVDPPAGITDLAATPSGASVTLTFTAPADDTAAEAVSSYDIRRSEFEITADNFSNADIVPAPVPGAPGSTETVAATGLQPETTYYFAAKAIDEGSNPSPISNIVSATTESDTTPPSKVTGVQATARDSRVRLSWDAATDDSGVDHYLVYQDGGEAAQTQATGTTISGLTNGTTYTFEVAAVDVHGNVGASSDPVTATPTAPPAVDGWLQFHGDPARTGAADGDAHLVPPHVLDEISHGDAVTTSPLVVDLDGDGVLDVVTVNELDTAGGRLQVRGFTHSADGSLAPAWTYTVPPSFSIGSNEPTSGYASLAAGDLDGDGTPEIAVYSNYLQNVPSGPSLNDGRLALISASGVELGALNNEIVIGLRTTPAVGDVDGDDLPEVVIVRQTGGTQAGYYVMATSYATGTFGPLFDTRVTGTSVVASPALADLDPAREGLEIVVGENGGNSAGRLYACTPGPGGAGCDASIATPTGVRGISVADLDGDGASEIAVSGSTGNSLSVVEAGDTLTISSIDQEPMWNTSSLGDVDGDGQPDIVSVETSGFVDDAAKNGTVRVAGWNGTDLEAKGSFSRAPTPGSSSQAPGSGALADLDGDGRLDLVIPSENGNLDAVTFDDTGQPSALWSTSVGGRLLAPVAIADVTGDGNADVVAANDAGRVVVVGNRGLTMAPVDDQAVAEGASLAFQVTTSDADGDAVTVTAQGLPEGATMSSTGAFSWTPAFNQAGLHGPITVTATDGSFTASDDFSITVTDVTTAPVITQPVDGALLNTSNVVISGTAQPGKRIRIIEGTVLGTTDADENGDWSTTLPFSEGTHTITARARDLDAGVTGPHSAPVTFTVDSTAPDAPVIVTPAQDAELDSPDVVVSGTAEPDTTLSLFEGGTEISTTAVGSDGSWSLTHTFEVGQHTVTAQTTDTAGHSSATSDPRSFRVRDVTAPEAPVIAAPVDGATFTTNPITVAGTAEPGSTVAIVEDGTSVGSATTDEAGTWSKDIVFADGEHTITATATDAEGNTSDPSAPVSFTVDANAPEAPVIVTPEEGAELSTYEVNVSGVAEADSTLTLFEDGAELTTTPVASDGTWQVTWTFDAGEHTLTATSVDDSGHTSAPSAPRTFSVLDTTAPDAPVITSPTGGSTLTSSTVDVAGTAAPASDVTIFDGGTQVGQTTALSDGTFSVDLPFADGTHTLTATATDEAGNVSAASDPVAFTVDTTITISLDYVTNPIGDPGDHAAARGTTEPGSAVSVIVTDGANRTQPKSSTAAADGTWQVAGIDVRALSNGTVTFTATATDAVGNSASAQRTSTKQTSASAPPAVTIVDDGFGHVVDPSAVTVRLAFNGPQAASDATLVLTDEDGKAVDAGTIAGIANGSPAEITVDISGLADGLITATASFEGAEVTDTALLDRGAPSATLDDPDAFYISVPFFGNTVFTGTAGDDVSGVAFVSVRLTGGATTQVTVRPAPDGTWRADFRHVQLLPGEYTVTAQAFDNAGNGSQPTSIDVTVL